jgi:flap endonuclease-1
MVESAKQLLDCMGVPWIQAPSEGEAMCAHLCKKNLVHAAASQDADALLFGSPRLVRNLSITGKRKLPKKETYVDIKPELIDLGQVLGGLGITQKQLVVLGMLVGTDYAPGVKGIGAKTALKVVKEQKTLEAAIAEVGWDADVPAAEIYEFFLHPPVEDKLADKFAEKLAGRREHEKHEHEMEWRGIDSGKLRDFMVAEHDFSAERVDKVIERLEKAQSAGAQSSLKGWLQK